MANPPFVNGAPVSARRALRRLLCGRPHNQDSTVPFQAWSSDHARSAEEDRKSSAQLRPAPHRAHPGPLACGCSVISAAAKGFWQVLPGARHRELAATLWHADGTTDFGSGVFQGLGSEFIDWACGRLIPQTLRPRDARALAMSEPKERPRISDHRPQRATACHLDLVSPHGSAGPAPRGP